MRGNVDKHRYKGTLLMIFRESWQAISGSGAVASGEMKILEKIPLGIEPRSAA